MTGNKKEAVVLQPRDCRVLSALVTLRILDREQAKIVGGFSSVSRANARLTALLRAGYLERFYFGTIRGGQKSLYALSKRGAVEIGAEYRSLKRTPGHVIGSDGFTAHQVHLTQVLVALKHTQPSSVETNVGRMLTFLEPLAPAVSLRPDGYVELLANGSNIPMFVEADLGTEPLKEWENKARNYLQLAVSGEFQKHFSHPQFRVVVVTISEEWLEHIRAAIAKLTDKIFWFTTFSAVNNQGIWAPIWLRPSGDQRRQLI